MSDNQKEQVIHVNVSYECNDDEHRERVEDAITAAMQDHTQSYIVISSIPDGELTEAGDQIQALKAELETAQAKVKALEGLIRADDIGNDIYIKRQAIETILDLIFKFEESRTTGDREKLFAYAQSLTKEGN